MKEIVIKLNDLEYEEIINDEACGLHPLTRAVAHGIVLPKGHGDLVDTNELEECKEMMRTLSGEGKFAVRMDDIRNVSPIIEADKEEE